LLLIMHFTIEFSLIGIYISNLLGLFVLRPQESCKA